MLADLAIHFPSSTEDPTLMAIADALSQTASITRASWHRPVEGHGVVLIEHRLESIEDVIRVLSGHGFGLDITESPGQKPFPPGEMAKAQMWAVVRPAE